ncbi:hypothetical protein [Motilimonas eburnea]|uniref:hypothetical protein n=1 Tax=Motilimonas eburnea TaxID=1737488 RepID=UPI001E488081|nr:hypothetical protein [Motilimonas eburnea]MCE2571760.1 hypothetical protein [Motilimonas eburnea]
MSRSSTFSEAVIYENSEAEYIDAVVADPMFYWFITGLQRINLDSSAPLTQESPELAEIISSKAQLIDELLENSQRLADYDAVLYCPHTFAYLLMKDGDEEALPTYHCVIENRTFQSHYLVPVAASMFDWVTSSGGFKPSYHRQKLIENKHSQPKETNIDWFTILDHRNFPIAIQADTNSDSYTFVLCPARAINLYVLDFHLVENTPPVNRAYTVVQCWDKDSRYPQEILFESDSEEDLYAYLVDSALYPNDSKKRPV